MINFIIKVYFHIQMEIDLMVYLKMVKKQQEEFIYMHLIDQNIKVNGLEIKEVVMV